MCRVCADDHCVRRGRDITKPVGGAYTDSIPDAYTDSNSNANPPTDAERRHHDHDYLRRRLTEVVDGFRRNARDVREQ